MSTASTRANASGQALTDLQIGQLRNLVDGSAAALTATAGDWGYQNLTASGTTVVKTGAGQLGTILVGTATGNITIYDNTAASGTIIFATAAAVIGPLVFNVSFTTGLTIVLSGAATATALYR